MRSRARMMTHDFFMNAFETWNTQSFVILSISGPDIGQYPFSLVLPGISE
jgi:hypothetical protein